MHTDRDKNDEVEKIIREDTEKSEREKLDKSPSPIVPLTSDALATFNALSARGEDKTKKILLEVHLYLTQQKHVSQQMWKWYFFVCHFVFQTFYSYMLCLK